MYCKVIIPIIMMTIILLAFVLLKEDYMPNQFIDVAIKCRNEEKCIYKGEKLFLFDIVISNRYKSVIGYPLEYLKTTGPIIKLIDTRTGKQNDVPTGPPDPALFEKFTMIPPGKSLILTWGIDSYDLKQFGGNNIDVTAEITMSDTILVDGKHISYEDIIAIRITNTDKQ